ncbi:serine/threonine protein kinase [Phytophthora nicotianae INRA-310]|uniref:Serine/threonine protein kinase n=2 Tax=Phytophthora nicotianae TaxID=4792 RepID=W2QRQ9_PHYN3|nr:serine/threonine protein kinase [Phytophthora nicotianae INRA-310]ETN15646.1 serine/threonine protein kinase [Phytophthora nicotianae INRA-310]KUF97937.1 CBL-interacting protein kinase 5 [Phytophthora nicotianae]
MWWFGKCAGCICRLSDVAPTSNWADLRPLMPSPASAVSTPGLEPRPGLYTARHRVTQELVALKVLDRRLLRQRATRRRLRQEVRVLQLAHDHQNLLQLHEVTSTGTRVELAFELARGGEVLARLHSERDVSRVIKQAALGLQFLHERGIVHGEVRPEHLLFSDDEPDARVLLAAFGRAAPWRSLTLRCRPRTRGFLWDDTHHIRFLPPFLLRRRNRVKHEDDRGRLVTIWREAQQIDVWALGVTLYVMLCGCFPFSNGSQQESNVIDIERRMLQDKLTFPEGGALLSRAARDLLRRLLEKNPAAAMSIEEVVAHPWLNGGVAPAVSWSTEILVQHDLFTARYAEEVAAVAYRPSVSASSAVSGLDNQSEVANAPPSRNSTLTSDGPRSSLGGGAVLKRETLEEEAGEEEARPSFMSTHGTPLLLDEEVQQERPSADCFMRLASLEMGGNNMNTNSDDEDVVADPGTGRSQSIIPANGYTTEANAASDGRNVTRQKSLDKMWQVLLRQRRFFSSRSLSSGSSNERS